MSQQPYKSNPPEQLEQDLLQQAWELSLAEGALEIQISERRDKLVRLRYIRAYLGL